MPEAVQALVMRAGIVVNVTPEDRRRLEAIVGDRNAPQKHVWRAKIILATADGCGTAEIMRRSGKAKPVVAATEQSEAILPNGVGQEFGPWRITQQRIRWMPAEMLTDGPNGLDRGVEIEGVLDLGAREVD